MRTALRPLRRWQAVIPAEPGEIGLFGRDPPLNRKLETGDLGPGKPDLCLRLVFRTLLELLARFDFGRAATLCRSDEEGRLGFIADERSELGNDLRRGAFRGLPDSLRSGVDRFEIRPWDVQLLALSSTQAFGGRPHRLESPTERLHIDGIVEDLFLRISAQPIDELGIPEDFEGGLQISFEIDNAQNLTTASTRPM